MSGTHDDRAVSMTDVIDAVESASLAELADLALYADAGKQAIDLVQRSGAPDSLCGKLAAQALSLTRRIPALRGYSTVLDRLSRGVRDPVC